MGRTYETAVRIAANHLEDLQERYARKKVERASLIEDYIGKGLPLGQATYAADKTVALQAAGGGHVTISPTISVQISAAKERGERQGKGGDRKSKSQDVTLIQPPKLSDLGIDRMAAKHNA